jgi:Glyoxalase-like domain
VIRGIGNIVHGVDDPEAAGERLRAEGVHVEPGGWHEQVGAHTVIVPLGPSYLELLGVGGERLIRWSMRTDRIDEAAGLLGVEVEDRSRRHPDGRLLRWRSAGIPESLQNPSLPFLVQWPEEDWPGNGAPDGQRLGWLDVQVPDRSVLQAHTLGADLPLRVTAGPPALVAVGLRVGESEVVVGRPTDP